MPRYAILSDIHANLEALTSVLGALDDQHIDQTFHLGDLVGYYANPNECIALVRERGITSVIGNHDRAAAGLIEPTGFTDHARSAILWTRANLTPENKQFLASLPLVCQPDDGTLLVHAALHPEPNDEVRITSEHVAGKSFGVLASSFPKAKIAFFGHTHRAAAYAHCHITTPAPIGDDATLKLRADSVYLVNPGSVGQSRDTDLRAAYAIYDTDTQIIHFRRANYDLLATRQKLSRSGILPAHPFLWRILRFIGIR